MEREDFVTIWNNLVENDKLSTISLTLKGKEGAICIKSNLDTERYKTEQEENYILVKTRQGNFTEEKYIPYSNILYVTGNIGD